MCSTSPFINPYRTGRPVRYGLFLAATTILAASSSIPNPPGVGISNYIPLTGVYNLQSLLPPDSRNKQTYTILSIY